MERCVAQGIDPHVVSAGASSAGVSSAGASSAGACSAGACSGGICSGGASSAGICSAGICSAGVCTAAPWYAEPCSAAPTAARLCAKHGEGHPEDRPVGGAAGQVIRQGGSRGWLVRLWRTQSRKNSNRLRRQQSRGCRWGRRPRPWRGRKEPRGEPEAVPDPAP